MSPTEALDILEQATNHPTLALNRQSHIAIMQAMDVIRDLVEPKPPAPPIDATIDALAE